ncbi:MAG: SDR family NAD(P)-dependent oxidoreductase, partial [Alphaproteobacteria bacterium]
MPLRAFNLHDQVALITGPAKGMGRAVTLTLAEAGADLVLVGRDTAEIEKVAEEVQQLGRKTLVIKCDVTSA